MFKLFFKFLLGNIKLVTICTDTHEEPARFCMLLQRKDIGISTKKDTAILGNYTRLVRTRNKQDNLHTHIITNHSIKFENLP